MAKIKNCDPFSIIETVYVTEKSTMLQSLAGAESNKSVKGCSTPKAVFLVHPSANKCEIAKAIETIYKERKVKVVKVNTINVKGKRRRVRGRPGRSASYRKAVVTFESGDSIEGLF